MVLQLRSLDWRGGCHRIYINVLAFLSRVSKTESEPRSFPGVTGTIPLPLDLFSIFKVNNPASPSPHLTLFYYLPLLLSRISVISWGLLK